MPDETGSQGQSEQKKRRLSVGHLIALLGVLVALFAALYAGYQTRRTGMLAHIDQRIAEKNAELIKEVTTPRVLVGVFTLEQARLSRRILDALDLVPSTIEIRHVGGGIAQQLHLEVRSSEPIVNADQWESAEAFEVQIDEARTRLLLTATQLRKGTSVGVTLLTEDIPKLDATLVIGVGQAVKAGDLVEFQQSELLLPEILRDDRWRVPYRIVWPDYETIASSATVREAELRSELADLEEERERLEQDTFAGWFWRVAKTVFGHVANVVLVLLVLFAILGKLLMQFPGQLSKAIKLTHAITTKGEDEDTERERGPG